MRDATDDRDKYDIIGGNLVRGIYTSSLLESLVPGNWDAGFGGEGLEKYRLTATRWASTLL